MEAGYTLFDTAIGTCGIAWQAGKVCRIRLPEADREETILRLLAGKRVFPENSPAPDWVTEIVEKLEAHLAGKPQDFSFVPFEWEGIPGFCRKVYETLLSIKIGKTATYGELAVRMGHPRAARAVGTALSKNPFPIAIPCHRIVGANGKPGGFSAFGGLETKEKILKAER